MFVYEVEGHMQKLSSFGRGKTIRPKKSLTWFLQAPPHLLKNKQTNEHTDYCIPPTQPPPPPLLSGINVSKGLSPLSI